MSTRDTIEDYRRATAEELFEEVCHDPSCSDPVCVDHIEHMLHARELIARVASGIAATAKRRAARPKKALRRAA